MGGKSERKLQYDSRGRRGDCSMKQMCQPNIRKIWKKIVWNLINGKVIFVRNKYFASIIYLPGLKVD